MGFLHQSCGLVLLAENAYRMNSSDSLLEGSDDRRNPKDLLQDRGP
jgi:hypothetical protein